MTESIRIIGGCALLVAGAFGIPGYLLQMGVERRAFWRFLSQGALTVAFTVQIVAGHSRWYWIVVAIGASLFSISSTGKYYRQWDGLRSARLASFGKS